MQMISQGASKVLIIFTSVRKQKTLFDCAISIYCIFQVNISLVVNDSEAKQCVRALHSAFFEKEENCFPSANGHF